MNRRRRQSPSSKVINQLRDYAVPLIGLLLLIVILYNVFSGDGSTTENTQDTSVEELAQNNTNKMSLDFDADSVSGSVEYSWGSSDDLTGKTEFYPGEKLIIDSGDVTLKWTNDLLMKLNKNGELKYDTNGDYLLSSSDLFIKTNEALNVNLRFLNASYPSGAIVSLNQNDVASTINVLSWTAQVSSYAGKSTTLKAWERLSITSIETTKEDFDIAAQVEEIWNYFFSETWAQENDLISYLKVDDSEENSDDTESWENEDDDKNGKYISISWLEDNKTYGASTLDISWELIDENVTKITFNNIGASINLVWKSFELKGFSISLRENDIVYKVYDTAGNVLERGVFTVYYEQGAESSSSLTSDSDTTDFPVTDSDPQFSFTAPTPNPYTSNEDFITIRGSATAWAATSVVVNGLTLKSFNGTSWRYHAATRFWTLKNGVNLYKVNYYNAAGTIVHTNTFTIIRKAPVVVPEPVAEAPATTPSTNDSGADSIADRIPLD